MNRGMWLGFLFFVVLVLLGFSTLLLGNIKLFKKTVEVTIPFDKVEGLRPGDDVRVEGVQYGKVKSIELDPRQGVLVAAELDGPLELHEGYEVYVESFTVLGGNYISVKRGDPSRPRAKEIVGRARPSALNEMGSIVAENRTSFRELVANLRDVSASLKESRGSMGKVINDPTLYERLLKIMDDGEVAMSKMRELAQTYIDELKMGKGPLRTMLSDEEMAQKLKEVTDSVADITKSMKNLSARLESGEGMVGAALYDKEMGERFKKIMENMETISDRFNRLTEKVEGSTVGRLMQEDGLYKQAEKSLEDADKFLGKVARTQVYVHTEAKFYPDSDHSIARVGVRIEPDDSKYFYGGVSAFSLQAKSGTLAFENQIEKGKDQLILKPDLAVAYRIPWILDKRITVRAGLLEGKPGGGVDFTWEDWGFFRHPVTFTFEARDYYSDVDEEDLDENVRGAMARAFVQTSLWNRGEEWWQKLLSSVNVYGGVNRIGNDPEYLVGIGLEWRDDDIRNLVGLLGLGR